MSSVPVEITINGPAAKVFDLVTQARFWPQWHVLTRAVTGVIERPYQPGDEFTEFIRSSAGTRELTWRVKAYDRPHSVTIELVTATNPGSIRYEFVPVEGGTLFRRVVEGLQDSSVSAETETTSVNNLKALVEHILADEAKGPFYPAS